MFGEVICCKKKCEQIEFLQPMISDIAFLCFPFVQVFLVAEFSC